MNQEDINKYIHTEIMGKCWHESRRRTFEEREPQYGWLGSVKGFKYPATDHTCSHCGCDIQPINSNGVDEVIDNYRFNYCADDKPRSLLNEVVAKVVKSLGFKAWSVSLIRASFPNLAEGKLPTEEQLTQTAPATAKHVAIACVEAHKASK